MRPFCALLWGGLLALSGCRTTPQSEVSPPTEATSAPRPGAELRGTRWLLLRLNRVPVPPTETGERYVQLHPTQGLAEGHAGCNRFRGSFEQLPGSQLRFGPLLTTKMACPALDTETAFLEALAQTRTYRISSDTLRLYPAGADAQPVAELLATAAR